MADNFKRPTIEYSDYRKDPENYVIVEVTIPGLKKKFIGNAPSNAVVELDKDENSFCLTVTVQGVTRPFRLKVDSLLYPITPDDTTYWKVKRENEVCVYIHKTSPFLWGRELRDHGLQRNS